MDEPYEPLYKNYMRETKKIELLLYLALTCGLLLFHLQTNASEIFNINKATISETKDTSDNTNIIGKEYDIGTVINSNEKMKWIVADYDKEKPSKVLLITKNIIDFREFNFTKTNYKNSKIRYYLNNEFYEKNFTLEEKKHILTSEIPVNIYRSKNENVNPIETMESIEEAEAIETITVSDKIFLLSTNEILKYIGNEVNLKRNSYAETICFDETDESINTIWTRDILNKYDKVRKVGGKNTKDSNITAYGGVVVGMWYDFSLTKTNENFTKEEKKFFETLLFDRKDGKPHKITYTKEDKSNSVKFDKITRSSFYEISFGEWGFSDKQKWPVTWYAVDDNGKEITLLSKNIIEYVELEYDTYDINELKDNPFDHSNLKSYLNDELYNKIFTDDEKNIIITVNDSKMRLPEANDIFKYDLLSEDCEMVGKSTINQFSRLLFDKSTKHSYFVNIPYEQNDMIYLMSVMYRDGIPYVSYNYSYIENNTADIIVSSGVRPMVKVDKSKLIKYLDNKSNKFVENDEYKKSLETNKISFNQKVKFGKYEQDGNLSNGKEDIEWRVISRKDDKYLLIADKVLDVVDLSGDFDIEFFDNTYAYYFANDVFLNEAFSEKEKEKLEVINTQYIVYYKEVLDKFEEDLFPDSMDYKKGCYNKVANLSTIYEIATRNLMYKDVFKTQNTKYVNSKFEDLDYYIVEDLAAYTAYDDMKSYVYMKSDGAIEYDIKTKGGFRPLICIDKEELTKIISAKK